MKKYLYCFGYKNEFDILDPSQDQQSCGHIFIEADSEFLALQWGSVISKWYVSKLNKGKDIPQWSPTDYCVWIEKNFSNEITEIVNSALTIQYGTYPDFSKFVECQRD